MSRTIRVKDPGGAPSKETRGVAVVVTDRRIVPPTRGNRLRILGLLRGFRALGWTVALISSDPEAGEELREEVDQLFVVRAPGFPGGDVGRFDHRPFRIAVERVTAALRPTLVVAEYAWLAPAIRRVSRGVLRVIDCHDVLHERTHRFRAAGLDPWVECTRDQEQGLLRCADVLLASQDRDADVLQALMPRKRVKSLLPSVDLPPGFGIEPTAMADVLAVGAMHAGNEGIRTFAATAWPTVMRACAEARLRIAGSIGEGMPPSPGVEWLGEIADLHDRYRRAAVVVCPVEVGTGVKIKMLEALRLGKAVVATPAAEEGLPRSSPPAWLTGGSVADFGEAVVSLLASRERRIQLEREAFAYGETHLSLPRFLEDLRSIIPSTSRRGG